MRIAMIGSFGERPDEGMRKLCAQMQAAAATQHEVVTVETGAFCSGQSWPDLRRFRPQCLHYLTGPTIRSLAALKFHQLTLPGRIVTVATGVRPYFGRIGRACLGTAAPDAYLAQAPRWARLFEKAGARIFEYPNGVDTARFRPVGRDRKRELKHQFGLPESKRIVLHVGHVKPNRNLDSLIDVQASGRYQVWIVGSQSHSVPGPWRQRLEQAGCIVSTAYVPAIEEVYQAADAYVFTVLPPDGEFPASYLQVGVIDFPLSILEAMACGLPVVTTRHDAVTHFLSSVAGLELHDGSGADALRQLDQVSETVPQTREAALAFDLKKTLARLDDVYAWAQQANSN